jgi:ferritin-like metal-binding protein YciE
MKIDSAPALLIDQIRDLYSVESQVILTLPELAAKATNSTLKDILTIHEEQTLKQKLRLKEAAKLLDENPEGDICKAMQGLIEGGNQHIAIAEGEQVRDMILIAHVTRIHHYEIAGYSIITTLARQLGEENVHELLTQSLEEEKASLEALTNAGDLIFGTAAPVSTS